MEKLNTLPFVLRDCRAENTFAVMIRYISLIIKGMF
jgi:hypothetical protein